MIMGINEDGRLFGIGLHTEILSYTENYSAILDGGPKRSRALQTCNTKFKKLSPIGQASFMQSLFRSLTDEYTYDYPDKRRAVFYVLNSQTKKDDIYHDPFIVLQEYIRAVYSLNLEDHTFSRSINNLLEAGKLFHGILKKYPAMLDEIVRYWQNFSSDFCTPVQQQYILAHLDHLEELVKSTNQRTRPITVENALLYRQIEELRLQDIPNKDIAQILDIKKSKVCTITRELMRQGRIPRMRPVFPRREKFISA